MNWKFILTGVNTVRGQLQYAFTYKTLGWVMGCIDIINTHLNLPFKMYVAGGGAQPSPLAALSRHRAWQRENLAVAQGLGTGDTFVLA